MELLLEKTSKACTMHLVGRDALGRGLGSKVEGFFV